MFKIKKRPSHKAIILLLCFPVILNAQTLRRDIKKMNNLFIFEFFMNFEICQKNNNLSTLVDYFPNPDYNNFKEINAESNFGGYNEILNFRYNENGIIEQFDYQVKDKIYRYEFVYEKNKLMKVLIGGNPKIYFKYDFFGRLLSITRETSSVNAEIDFSLVEGQNKANIKLYVIQNGKKEASRREYFIAWNNLYKIDSYSFDVYSGEGYKYNTKGDLLSFVFSNVMRDNNMATWNYTYDEKGIWIEKRDKETFCKRSITYLK